MCVAASWQRSGLSFDDVSDVMSTSPNAKVEGVLIRLSPIKKTSIVFIFATICVYLNAAWL